MAFRLKIVPDKTNFDFFRHQWLTFGGSMVLTVLAIALWAIMGLNFGIDFRGGTTIRTESTNAVNIAEEVYAGRQKLREAGQETSVNVLDSLSELKTAQINFVDASYNARLSVYRVLRAVGHLRAQDMGLQDPLAPTVVE